jgi:hypothetical protein
MPSCRRDVPQRVTQATSHGGFCVSVDQFQQSVCRTIFLVSVLEYTKILRSCPLFGLHLIQVSRNYCTPWHLVRRRNILTELLQVIGEDSPNFWWYRNGSLRSLISVFWTGAATFFYSSSPSVILTRLSRPRSRPTITLNI